MVHKIKQEFKTEKDEYMFKKGKKEVQLDKIFTGLPRPHFVRPRNDEKTCHPECRIDLCVSTSCNFKPSPEFVGSHSAHQQIQPSHKERGYKKKVAFTLAEVLITLGIIGVVAAMTLPSLLTKYEKKRTATAVKKVYSELTQVIQRAEVDYGEFKYWDMNGDSLEGRRLFVNKYIKPYYKGYNMLSDGKSVALWDNNGVSGNGINGILPNGTVISIAVVSNDLYVLVDVNGFSRPNKMGRDIFYFNTLTGKLMPSGWQSNLTREMALNGYVPEKEGGLKFSCKRAKTNDDDNYTDVKHACTSLLMLDGWEFKDDYPW